MTSRNRKESENGIKLSGGTCVICGWCKHNSKGVSLVVGAHVRPFESGAEFDNANNIIALCPNHHAEYDNHNFYIDVKTGVVHFINSDDEFDGINISDKIKHIKKEYLAYNKYLFDKKHN